MPTSGDGQYTPPVAVVLVFGVMGVVIFAGFYGVILYVYPALGVPIGAAFYPPNLPDAPYPAGWNPAWWTIFSWLFLYCLCFFGSLVTAMALASGEIGYSKLDSAMQTDRSRTTARAVGAGLIAGEGFIGCAWILITLISMPLLHYPPVLAGASYWSALSTLTPIGFIVAVVGAFTGNAKFR